MGIGLVPILETRIKSVDPYNIEGKALASAWPEIDDIARRLGVTTIEDLGDNEEFDEEEDELDGPPSEVPWYDAADGLRTVTALREELTANPDALPDSDEVASDLEEIQDVLAAAEEHKVRFRFTMLG